MAGMPASDDRPTADVSVRVAWTDDAPAVAAVQVRAWGRDLAGLVDPAALPTEEQVEAVWRQAMARPEDARNRVLVALERNRVVGFAVTTPAPDPDCDPVADGELVELVVHPEETGKGHGSRLLQAAAETLSADHFTRAVHWVATTDDQRRAFLEGAGWAPDQGTRELALGDGDAPDDAGGEAGAAPTLRQVRLHTSLQ